MNAYAVILELFERDYEDGPWEAQGDKIKIITVAESLYVAAKFAAEAYKKADETEKEFEWQVIVVEQLDGLVALPPFKTGLPPKTK